MIDYRPVLLLNGQNRQNIVLCCRKYTLQTAFSAILPTGLDPTLGSFKRFSIHVREALLVAIFAKVSDVTKSHQPFSHI